MAKLTQKERRERKKLKALSAAAQDVKATDMIVDSNPPNEADEICAICMDSANTSKSIILDCGHRFHKSCLYEWNSTQLKGKPLNLFTPLKENHNNGISMLIHLDGTGLINFVCCRTEYIMIGTTDVDGDIIPKKVLAKIKFAELYGEIPVQYITNVSQLVWYLPKTAAASVNFDIWGAVLSSLVNGIEDGTDTEIDAMFCDCNNECCDGMFLMNKELWNIAAHGGHNGRCIRPMDVLAISKYVASREEVRRVFNIK